VIEVYVSATGLAGTVTIDSSASLYVEYIRPGRTTFTATATQTTFGTDLNLGTAASLEWTEGVKSPGFTHDDGSNPENIFLEGAGDYLVFVNVPLNLPGAQIRTNVRLLIQDDGITVPGGEAKQGYIRNASGHIDASVHWSGLIRNVGAGSILTVKTQQEGEAGTVNVQSGQTASIFVEKVDSSINLFFSRATRLAGPSDNWNPNTATDILWENDVITYAADFTHSSPDQITVNNDVDYLLIYNDSFTSALQRASPQITVNVNGFPVTGAETKSHYIRGGSLHTESSGTLVFLLEGLSSGDTISMSSVAEAVTGTVDDNQDSLLILWRKR
jgi:hypothetical protein